MNRSPRYARKLKQRLKQRVREHQHRELRAAAQELADKLRADLARADELAEHYRVPWWKFWTR